MKASSINEVRRLLTELEVALSSLHAAQGNSENTVVAHVDFHEVRMPSFPPELVVAAARSNYDEVVAKLADLGVTPD